MSDFNCPLCGEEQEISPDHLIDGLPHDGIVEHECHKCLTVFHVLIEFEPRFYVIENER